MRCGSRPHDSHFNVDEALELIRRVGPRQAFLTHMSHDIGLHAADYGACRRTLAWRTTVCRSKSTNHRYENTLENKVVVITGASVGHRRGDGVLYAAQGACVVLGARSTEKLQLIAGDIRAKGGRAAFAAST